MILNGNTIEKLIKEKKLIENANLENIHSSSYDLTTGEYILKFKTNKKAISLLDASALDNMYEQINIKGYQFKPGECILVPLEDLFNMPDNICAHLRGRTSYNRLGLFTTIQHINPGYRGKLNISITNNSPNTYTLLPNIRICQVVFEYMNTKVRDDLLYSNENKASYQDENGLQGSKVYNDFIGKVVRHFKGNYYYIEDICLNTEDEEYMIIYKALYGKKGSNTWARPAKMFFEEIDPNKSGNITHQTHRFEVVEDLTIDHTKLW